MKITSAAMALLATHLPASTLARDCVVGSVEFEFQGPCTPGTVFEAYADQVFYVAGATASDCASSASSAATDLESKISSAGMSGVQALCDAVYAAQNKVPFSNAANRGTDLQFEGMFYNGRTDWQEEVETIYEKDDQTPSSVLQNDAAAVKAFYEGGAQGRRVEWPGELPNFQSSVEDSDGLATCTTNAAMCCWPKDRQANDANGNCAKPYDTNCVDKDVADNTNLCFVDVERGNASTGYESDNGFLNFPKDNNDGEGAIHCHGLAWSNNVNDHTARYKANNLFFVSMYDHMHQRGYVKNVPGAPMCGCVEQMPTVSRSDCTQVDLTETTKITYNAETKTFRSKLTHVEVDFNSCKGINNRSNDLWAYMARLYYQGDITPNQFGEAGRIITDNGCDETTQSHLNRKGLTGGYDHDVSTWTNVAGTDSMRLHDDYGHRAFNRALAAGASSKDGHHGIIFRICQSCIRTHKKIYYRRRTAVPDDFALIHNFLNQNNDGSGDNKWTEDFSLHSTYEDAVSDSNPWQCPNDTYNYKATFYGDCSPDGTRVVNQRRLFQNYPSDKDRRDVAFFVNQPEEEGLQVVPTTAIYDYGLAGGMALKDDDSGDIYMTGSGGDIWSDSDSFNYLSESVEGDQTVIVHAGSISSPQPHGWSKSGIMFRSSADANAANYILALSGSNGVYVSGRETDGADTGAWYRGNSGVTSSWLKVEKRVNTFTSFVASDDDVSDGVIEWTIVNSREMPAIGGDGESYLAGLAVTSRRTYAQEVIFKGYELSSYYFPSAAPSSSSMPTAYVPSLDIGDVGVAGSSTLSNDGRWTVRASGSDIWSHSDQFHYVNFKQTGNVVLELLVDSFDYTYGWQKGGIMVRENLEQDSKHFSLYCTGFSGLANQWRTGNGSYTHNKNTSSNQQKLPVWIQIKKEGDQFYTAYKSAEGEANNNGGEWTAFTGPTTMNFEGEFWVGIAVTSHDNSVLTTLVASEFNIIEGPATFDRQLRGE